MSSKMNKKNSEEFSLDAINKQIAEMKKKISLLEGQRKAHYEMWDTEKKQNGERIKISKENIRKLYTELAKSTTVAKNMKICDKLSTALFANKKNDEAIESLDFKVIEARKKLDLLQHEVNQKQEQIVEFSIAQTAHPAKIGSGISKQIVPNSITVTSLENQIHQVEINNMEAEHLKKKYKTIRNQLLDESVGFESTLKKLEEKISQQENEISRLQKAYEEAILLRNMTYETLAEQEKNLIKVQQTRENELEQLRFKVENYKSDLERLERHMYPVKTTTRRDSQSGLHDGETEMVQQSEYLEKIFDTLKEATGVIENEDVLKRFLSQKDTKLVLEKMKSYSENEKQQLIKKKEEITTELETHKFADMKDQERSEEELEALQDEIQKENENYEQVNEEYEKLQQQIKTIMERIHQFCLQMKDFDVANVPEKCPSIEKCEWLLRLFRTKVESAMRLSKGKSEKKKEKVKSADLWVHLPYNLDSKVSDVDDEEEVPTRNSLKREAQIIYETRNRKKAYRVGMGK